MLIYKRKQKKQKNSFVEYIQHKLVLHNLSCRIGIWKLAQFCTIPETDVIENTLSGTLILARVGVFRIPELEILYERHLIGFIEIKHSF